MGAFPSSTGHKPLDFEFEGGTRNTLCYAVSGLLGLTFVGGLAAFIITHYDKDHRTTNTTTTTGPDFVTETLETPLVAETPRIEDNIT